MISHGNKNILGIIISAVDYEFAVAKIMECARENRRCRTTALAVHGVVTGALDRAHAGSFISCWLAQLDWMLRHTSTGPQPSSVIRRTSSVTKASSAFYEKCITLCTV